MRQLPFPQPTSCPHPLTSLRGPAKGGFTKRCLGLSQSEVTSACQAGAFQLDREGAMHSLLAILQRRKWLSSAFLSCACMQCLLPVAKRPVSERVAELLTRRGMADGNLESCSFCWRGHLRPGWLLYLAKSMVFPSRAVTWMGHQGAVGGGAWLLFIQLGRLVVLPKASFLPLTAHSKSIFHEFIKMAFG